jgi:hypothetical protein
LFAISSLPGEARKPFMTPPKKPGPEPAVAVLPAIVLSRICNVVVESPTSTTPPPAHCASLSTTLTRSSTTRSVPLSPTSNPPPYSCEVLFAIVVSVIVPLVTQIPPAYTELVFPEIVLPDIESGAAE